MLGTAQRQKNQVFQSSTTSLRLCEKSLLYWRIRKHVRQLCEQFLRFVFLRFDSERMRKKMPRQIQCEWQLLEIVTDASGNAVDDDRVCWFCKERPFDAIMLFVVKSLLFVPKWKSFDQNDRMDDLVKVIRRSCSTNGDVNLLPLIQKNFKLTISTMFSEWDSGTLFSPHYSIRCFWQACLCNNAADPLLFLQKGTEKLADLFFFENEISFSIKCA